jgi:hypothetical protein
MKEKVLTQSQWDLLANLVLAEMGRLGEFSRGRSEEVAQAIGIERGKLHTLYNYLIE